jgi:GABA(A) receptor-associated protein
MEFKFKKDTPDLLQRRNECDKIRKQFPDKIPIICEKDPKSKIQEIDKTKYLVPMDLTVGQFSLMIRKRVEIAKEDAFYLLVDGKHSIIGDSLISEIYDKYKSEDGFLYIAYASEVTWGY